MARTRTALLSSILLLSLACGESDDAEPKQKICSGKATLAPEGFVLTDDCESRLTLAPRVKIDGAWRAPNAACSLAGNRLSCPLEAGGQAVVMLDGAVVSFQYVPDADQIVQGLSLEGGGTLDGATGWLSNGFQSWSQSGVIAIAAAPSDADLETALAARGDGEVIRDGSELSWSTTFAGGGKSSFFAGVLSEKRWRAWASVHRDGATGVRVRLVSGASGEAVSVSSGEPLDAEPWHVELGGDLEAAQTRWSDALPSRARDVPRPASAGWNSWYDLWDGVDEASVRENAPLAREILEPLLPAGTPLRIVLDDGWQKAWGDWEPNEKFPAGLSALTTDLKAQGYETGIWLAPLLVAESSQTALSHPEWLVGGASYKHGDGLMRVLDVTHPEAAQHLSGVISQIVGWGFGLLKIDFLFAGTFDGQRAEAVTPMQAYARALEIIRAAAGEETLLTAVGAPGVASLPWVDAWRVGGDIALQISDVAWAFLPSQARSIAARWPICRATACDGDPALLRELERNEVEAGGTIAALAGGALFLSDDLRSLPVERKSWGLDARRAGWAISKRPAVPQDPFPAAPPETLSNVLLDLIARKTSHVVPTIWSSDDGGEILLNVSDEPQTLDGVEVPAHSAEVR